MSGEAGGAIIGGLLLIPLIPVVLAGAAVVGIAAGIGALGAQAVKAGAEHHEKTKLEVDNCSAELNRLYSNIRGTIQKQNQLTDQYYQKVEKEMRQAEASLRQSVQAGKATQVELDKMLQDARTSVARKMTHEREAALEKIRQETQREAAGYIAEIDRGQQLKLEMDCWKNQTEAEKANQRTLAMSMMRDAQSTIDLLRTLALSSGDVQFTAKVNTYINSYDTAKKAMSNGSFQAAASAAQKIISGGASLALEYELQQAERDGVRTALISRLSGLAAELESQSWVKFETADGMVQEEALDDFVQGEYEKLQNEIQQMLGELRSDAGRGYGSEKLQVMLDEVENEFVPRTARTIECAQKNLMSYYERLRALEIISEYMQGQGYIIDWSQAAGDDASQKLVVHFTQRSSGNRIAVAFDQDTTTEDIGKMAMEVMFYFADGRTISESEKSFLRGKMVAALEKEGLAGHLACVRETENREANDKNLDDRNKVQALPVEPIVI